MPKVGICLVVANLRVLASYFDPPGPVEISR